MGEYLCAGGLNDARITIDMIVVVMGVENLRDFPTSGAGCIQALLKFERVNGERSPVSGQAIR